jgi:hypothetical protein
LAFSNEATVAIPSDDDPLRFPLPEPEASRANAFAVQPAPAVPSATQSGAALNASAVAPAIYNQPADIPSSRSAVPSLAGDAQAIPPMKNSSGSWRPPQIHRQIATAQPTAASAQIASMPTHMNAPALFVPGKVVVAPTVSAAPNMDVRLRAVPSPDPEPASTPAPRIRLPGYTAAPITNGVEQAAYLSPTAAVQTVQITPLSFAQIAAPPASIVAASSADGFRPRGSMR